jgi:hypothetical protein
MRLINLTPHAITIDDRQSHTTTIPPAGPIARVLDGTGESHQIRLRDGTSVELVDVHPGRALTGLPDPVPGILFLVSWRVAYAARARTDLLFPVDVFRDHHGRVVACRRLGRVADGGTGVDERSDRQEP